MSHYLKTIIIILQSPVFLIKKTELHINIFLHCLNQYGQVEKVVLLLRIFEISEKRLKLFRYKKLNEINVLLNK